MPFGDNGGWEDNVLVLGRRAGGVARRHIKWIVPAVVALLLSATSYFQVEPDEVGVVTRFGKFVRITLPGPHFKLPLGIERVETVPVQRQLKQEFGFRTTRADVRSQYSKKEYSREALMLTGDLNVARVEWIVQYKISDPYKYLYKVKDVTDTFRAMAEATMRRVVGDYSVSEVITSGRNEIQTKAKQELQALSDEYGIGIEVLELRLQNVDPPEEVRDAWNEVNRAEQEKDNLINQANAEYNKIIPEARGKAEQVVSESEGYAAERVNEAKGDVARFVAVEHEYAKAPRVTRTRIYLETMADVLPRAGKRLFLDDGLKSLVPLLNLGGGGAQ